MTTREKIVALVDALRTTPPDAIDDDARNLVELLQIAQGMGVDLLALIVPATDAEADVLVDKLLCLLLEVRGDDLPPFDPERYGEAVADGA